MNLNFKSTLVFIITFSFLCFIVTQKGSLNINDVESMNKTMINFLDSLRKDDSIDAKSCAELIVKYNNYGNYFSSNKSSLIYIKTEIFGTVPFRVTVPENYDQLKRYPAILILHGATGLGSFEYAKRKVKNVEEERELGISAFKDYATKEKYVIIEAFSDNKKGFNWLLLKDNKNNALSVIDKFLRNLKSIVNIDDTKLYVAGHSDGSDGAWAFLSKKPNLFCSALIYNSMCIVFYSPIYLKNLVNRKFYVVHSDLDDIRPIQQTRDIIKLLKNIKVNLNYKEYLGYRHGDSHIKKDMPLGFNYLKNVKRNPFGREIYWETSDLYYNECDWIKINELALNNLKAKWHQDYNVKTYDKIKKNYMISDYYLLEPSGAIKASFSNNLFTIETSRVKRFEIFISPKMINLNNPVVVKLNNKVVYEKKATYNKEFLISNFRNTRDKQALWINKIQINVTNQ